MKQRRPRPPEAVISWLRVRYAAAAALAVVVAACGSGVEKPEADVSGRGAGPSSTAAPSVSTNGPSPADLSDATPAPSADTSSATTSAAAVTTPAAGTSAPACRGADLDGRVERSPVGGAAAGSFRVAVTNVGASPCLVTYYASGDVLDDDGKPAGLMSAVPLPGLPDEPALFPGGTAQVFGSWSWCGPRRPVALRLRVRLNSGDNLDLPAADVPPRPCHERERHPGSVSFSTWTALGADMLPLRNPQESLELTVEMPAHARMGQRVKFRVILHNRHASPVPLSPCPELTLGIRGLDHRATEWIPPNRALDCAGAPAAVPPGGTVTFEQELVVPAESEMQGPLFDGNYHIEFSIGSSQASAPITLTGGAVKEQLGSTGLVLTRAPAEVTIDVTADQAAAAAREILGESGQQPVLKLIEEAQPGAADRVRRSGMGPVTSHLVWLVLDAGGTRFAAINPWHGTVMFAGAV